MKYNLKISFLNLIRHKSLILLQIVCLSLSMITVTFFLSQANGAIENVKKDIAINRQNSLVRLDHNIFSEGEEIHLQDIEYFGANDNVLNAEYSIRYFPDQILSDNEYMSFANAYIVSKNYSKIYTKDTIHGSWIQKDNECVIAKFVAELYHLKINDKIYINSKEFVIKGILNIEDHKDIFILFQDDFDIHMNDYTIYLFSDDPDTLARKLGEFSGEYSIQTSKEIIDQAYNRLKRGWSYTIFICLLSMSYGFFAVNNIIRFYINKRMRKIAIMLAYGATKRDIFAQLFMELLAVNFISISLISIIVKLINNYAVKLNIYILTDYKVYLINLLLAVLPSFLIIKSTVNKIFKNSIVSIFKEKFL